MRDEFRRLRKRAAKRGWVVPINDVFSNAVWIRYWEAMEESEKDPSKGRPIAPHRSGGGQSFL
jgi:nicotinamide mononucleotide adenylyltransferase